MHRRSADNYAITYQPGTLHVVYHFSGFLAPLAGPGPHRVAAGIPVVLRWRLTDANGTAVVDPASLSAVTTARSRAARPHRPAALRHRADPR